MSRKRKRKGGGGGGDRAGNEERTFLAAKNGELAQWEKLKVYKVVPFTGQGLIDPRWFLINKGGCPVVLVIQPWPPGDPQTNTLLVYRASEHDPAHGDILEGRVVEYAMAEEYVTTIIHDPRELLVLTRRGGMYTALTPTHYQMRGQGPPLWFLDHQRQRGKEAQPLPREARREGAAGEHPKAEPHLPVAGAHRNPPQQVSPVGDVLGPEGPGGGHNEDPNHSAAGQDQPAHRPVQGAAPPDPLLRPPPMTRVEEMRPAGAQNQVDAHTPAVQQHGSPAAARLPGPSS